jgi:hypothetical protein
MSTAAEYRVPSGLALPTPPVVVAPQQRRETGLVDSESLQVRGEARSFSTEAARRGGKPPSAGPASCRQPFPPSSSGRSAPR